MPETSVLFWYIRGGKDVELSVLWEAPAGATAAMAEQPRR